MKLPQEQDGAVWIRLSEPVCRGHYAFWMGATACNPGADGDRFV